MIISNRRNKKLSRRLFFGVIGLNKLKNRLFQTNLKANAAVKYGIKLYFCIKYIDLWPKDETNS